MKNSEKPAYPGLDDVTGNYNTGLTKREKFAMAAMQGMLSNKAIHKDMNEIFNKGEDPVQDIAESSIVFADALLKELEETQ